MNTMTRECYCCHKKLYNSTHIPPGQKELKWFLAIYVFSTVFVFLFLLAEFCAVLLFIFASNLCLGRMCEHARVGRGFVLGALYVLCGFNEHAHSHAIYIYIYI